MGAVFAAGLDFANIADVRLFDVVLDSSWGNQPGFFGKVHHVVRFGGDVPEQLLSLFGSLSEELHVLADILCRIAV